MGPLAASIWMDMNMRKTISFPQTDLPDAYPVGLGTANVGVSLSEVDAPAILDAFLDLGGNVIDTARVYGAGDSERIIGGWIRRRGRHDDFILITKGGHPLLESMHTPRMRKEDMDQDLEASLRALGVDCIDVYFYHRDDTSQPVAALLECMEEYVRQGKIRYYGCSNWSAARIQEAYAYAEAHGLQGFRANQMLYNMGQKYMAPLHDDTLCAMDSGMIEIHRTQDNLAIPYFGLCSGFFHTLDASGECAVKNSPYCTPGNLFLKKKIDSIRQETGATITQVLLGFYYAQDFPALPLASTSSLPKLRDIMKAPEVRIDPAAYLF